VSIKILHKGIADSIQDNGRYGFQHFGVQPNGCMDMLSSTLANYILQNDLNSPVIEIHFPSSKIQFLDDTIICITGANFVPVLNEKSIALNRPILVHKNDVLTMLQPLEGSIAYLGIKGSYSEPTWLNSHASNNKRLSADDILHFTTPENDLNHTLQQINNILDSGLIEGTHNYLFDNHEPIRFLPGPAWNDLTESAIQDIIKNPFTISAQRNRMGYPLNGSKLSTTNPTNYLSSAVTRGTLQLLPNGDIIVLMADHQTIGGYANLGQIILVDLPRFAQMKNGIPFKFSLTNLDTAQTLYKSMYAPFKY
jgi:antagonist of KipI